MYSPLAPLAFTAGAFASRRLVWQAGTFALVTLLSGLARFVGSDSSTAIASLVSPAALVFLLIPPISVLAFLSLFRRFLAKRRWPVLRAVPTAYYVGFVMAVQAVLLTGIASPSVVAWRF